MPKDWDDQLDQEGLSLELILAEFGSGKDQAQRWEDTPTAASAAQEPPAPPEEGEAPAPEAPPQPEPEAPDEGPELLPVPERPRKRRRQPPKAPPDTSPDAPRGVITAFPGPGGKAPLPPLEEGGEKDDEGDSLEDLIRETVSDGQQPPQEAPKVLEFPAPEPASPLGQLRRRADNFADHMFEEEGSESAKSVRRAERLIPGVDEEAPRPQPARERRPRRQPQPAPDLPPKELGKRYSKGLKAARLRCLLAFFPMAIAFYLTLAPSAGWPLPPILEGDGAMQCFVLAGLQGLTLLLGADAFVRSLIRPFQRRLGMDLLVSLANLAALADALTLAAAGAAGRQPFCAPAALGMWCVLFGALQERRGQRMACRMAASASEPYLVTRDEGKWNNRDTYAKWSGPLNGFGSQIQESNGAQRIYRVTVPVLLAAALLFSLLSSLGRQRPEDLLWCLAAILTATASLSATLCFGLPWRRISTRLAGSGAALAGWQGVTNTTGSSNLLLTDIDLFPVGSVSLNGVKVFGDVSVEKVVAVTATVIRDTGSGLEKVFHDLLRSQGAVYRRGESFTTFEGGGASEIIRGEQILVGSASFMVLMDVALPPGLKVKNAVFCAIDGELAGIFALNYHLPGNVPPALDSLIRNKITPVLCTRDFNLIPSMLRQRFKLPVDKMEFPPIHRRRELSQPDQEHSQTLTAVLCREGVGPYAEAVVGGRRLRSAVRLSAVLSCLGSAAGALLSFYLTFVAAYASLTPVNLTIFLLMWLVPTPLISHWVDQY